MTTAEIKDLLDQMADAGVFYLTISGGEILMRRDFFEILEHARVRTFCIKLKTNGVLIREQEAERHSRTGRGIGADQHLFASARSARRDHQDARLAAAVDRCGALAARAQGLRVIMANVLMRQNAADYPGVKALAAELGAQVHPRSDDHAHDGWRPVHSRI